MNTTVKTLLLFFICLVAADLFAQDPAFSQFDANQLYYNPAYTGYKKGGRIEASYRNLWPNVPGKTLPGPLSTYTVMGDAYLSIRDKFNAGVGGFVMQDVEGQGFLTTTSVGISYAQHMPHIRSRNDRQDRFNIYIGFKAYYNYIHLDWSRLVFSDQLNSAYGITGPSSFDQTAINHRGYADFDYGVLIRNNYRALGKWYNELGFSMAHVLQPSISITGSNSDASRLPRKYVFTYRGTVALKDDNFYIGPTLLVENQAKFYEVNGGVDFYLKMGKKHESIPLSIGLYNRFSFITKNSQTGEQKINTSAVILNVTHRGNFVNAKNAIGYSIGASVDFPYMGLGMQTAGAYEITMGLFIPYKKSSVMKCPFEAF